MLLSLTRSFRAIADSVSRLRTSRSSTGGAAPAHLEGLEGRLLMSTYYVSASGSDSNSGTSPSSAWKTSAKVSGHHFSPGDAVLFQGGQSFGGLTLFNEGGSPSDPVEFSSYGSGRATIAPGKGRGAWLLNSTGIIFENLNFSGSPGAINYQDGIRIEKSNGGTMSSVVVDNCTITGFAEGGITFGTDSGGSYLSGIKITNNQIYDNVEAGIVSYSTAQNDTGIYIAGNSVHDNYGDGHSVCTGSGIMLGGLNGADVEHNVAYNNGAIGGNGGVGIWAFSSNNVTFQYNESYSNHTEGAHDGDGFDFDADVSNSIMQYNYAFDNDGSGAMVDQWKNDNTQTNDIMRFNVLVNNARKNNYGNLEVWGKVLNAYLYNNVIYTTPGTAGTNSGIRVHNSTIPGLYVNNVRIVNNIIDASNGAKLINVPAGETQGAKNLSFLGNVYWTNGAAMNITYGTSSVNSLAAFQNIGQEKWNGAKTGIFADPKFQNASPGAIPAASTNSLASAAAGFKLQAGSPALSEALSLSSLFGVNNGGADYFGDTFSGSAATVAGADQSLRSGVTATVISSTTSTTTSTTSSSSSSNSSSSTTTSSVPTTNVSNLTGYDIGAVGSKGSNTASSGTFTVTASGADIWGAADAMRFDETSLSGNGTIIANISSMSDANQWAKVGIMVRSGLGANAQEVSLLLCPDKSADLETRASTGASTTSIGVASTSAHWVKLVRSGNTFTGYLSTDGKTWTEVGSTTVAMSSNVMVGLAVTSHTTSASETATFSNVSIT